MLIHELPYAVRSLGKARGFTLAVILSLALGISGNIAIFSLLNAVLLKPLPYPDAGRLVVIKEFVPEVNPTSAMPVKAAYVPRWRTELQSFESIGAAIGAIVNLTGVGQAESIGTLRVTAELLDVLGAKPQFGRWFRRVEEESGQPDVVILSDSLWRRRFSADPQIVGRKILLDSRPHEVVGVTPVGMPFYRGQLEAFLPERAELFVPMRLTPGESDLTKVSSTAWCAAIGRLKRGITLEQAHAEIEVSMSALSRIARENVAIHARIEPLQRALVGDTRGGLLVLMGAVGFVLLIVCVNIANLSMVRATRTRRELAVRSALGAGRRQLIVQPLAESLLIAVAGTGLGLLAALWIIDFVIAGAPARLPRIEAVTVDGNVLAFSVGLCALTAILFGLLPAWRMSRIAPLESLHSASRGNTDVPHGSRLRAMLVSAEVGLTTLLLIGAGLLLFSFQRVMNVPRGFEVENIHTVGLSLPDKYRTFEQRVSFFRQVHEAVAAVPGVERSGYGSGGPLLGVGSTAPAIKEGTDNLPLAALPMASWMSVSSGYFGTLGIPLRSGRLFAEGEPGRVALVSETAAQRVWPGEDPIGKKIRHMADRAGRHWFTIIGVVGDVRSTALDRAPDCLIYYPYWHLAWQGSGDKMLALHVRTAIEAKALATAIREQVRNVDPEVPIREHAMMRAVSDSVAQRRFQAFMVAMFAAVALLLASIGIYGVVSYSVAQRRGEIGVRLVLGATRRDIASLVLRHGMRPVLAGLTAGLVAAAMLARLIGSLLFEVRPWDPITFVTAPVALALVAALACYLPARRGASADPMSALRYE
jgi:predicted permease